MIIFNLFGWILTANINGMDDDSKAFYAKKKQQFYGGWKICLDYYTSRSLPLKTIDSIGCLWFAYATCGQSKDELLSKSQSIKTFVTTGQYPLIDDLTNAYSEHLEIQYANART